MDHNIELAGRETNATDLQASERLLGEATELAKADKLNSTQGVEKREEKQDVIIFGEILGAEVTKGASDDVNADLAENPKKDFKEEIKPVVKDKQASVEMGGGTGPNESQDLSEPEAGGQVELAPSTSKPETGQEPLNTREEATTDAEAAVNGAAHKAERVMKGETGVGVEPKKQ